MKKTSLLISGLIIIIALGVILLGTSNPDYYYLLAVPVVMVVLKVILFAIKNNPLGPTAKRSGTFSSLPSSTPPATSKTSVAKMAEKLKWVNVVLGTLGVVFIFAIARNMYFEWKYGAKDAKGVIELYEKASKKSQPVQQTAPAVVTSTVSPGDDLVWGINRLVPGKRYFVHEHITRYPSVTDPALYFKKLHFFRYTNEEKVHFDMVFNSEGKAKVDYSTLVNNGATGRLYFTVDEEMDVTISGTQK